MGDHVQLSNFKHRFVDLAGYSYLHHTDQGRREDGRKASSQSSGANSAKVHEPFAISVTFSVGSITTTNRLCWNMSEFKWPPEKICCFQSSAAAKTKIQLIINKFIQT
uniref:(northern house mosquito) hypothetical protein n=1 Tax=Culex pipiens TaxID=7175 RepID=A0A8D8JIW0_CULPI